ncbi:MAG: hypothetical protein WB626_12240 [Bacteroidota bacterium]
MDDAVGVGFLEGSVHLDGAGDRILQVLCRNYCAGCFALHVFHHDERLTVMPLDVVNGAYVGVVEDCSSRCFLRKSRPFRFMGMQVAGHGIQNSNAGECEIFGFGDDTHAALAGREGIV